MGAAPFQGGQPLVLDSSSGLKDSRISRVHLQDSRIQGFQGFIFRTQGFKDSRIQGFNGSSSGLIFKDSRIQGLKDSMVHLQDSSLRTQGFKDSRIQWFIFRTHL
jgi:hypothetical protein